MNNFFPKQSAWKHIWVFKGALNTKYSALRPLLPETFVPTEPDECVI